MKQKTKQERKDEAWKKFQRTQEKLLRNAVKRHKEIAKCGVYE